ncbi:MAG: putative nucleotidyltransferase substrate binding domain-containing protein [Micropruina sp.]|uniref:putative nucleotidyltransferase substrate binding domain-containing protein n=1 Tax=Micropruina sp. TaxID=2737536 RepID=UPI0039E3FEBF
MTAVPTGRRGALVPAMAALAATPPFAGLDAQAIEGLATASRIAEYREGELILDAFRAQPSEVVVVVSGKARVWRDAERPHDPAAPDLICGPGEVFGLDATLTGKAIGPLVVADGPLRVLRVPADRAAHALPEADEPPDHGVLAADDLAEAGGRIRLDDVAVDPLVIVAGTTSVREAAAAMPDTGVAGVRLAGGGLGVVTDRVLRQRVLAAGLSPETPVGEIAVTDLPSVDRDASATEALILLLDARTDHVLVTGPDGGIVGTVEARDFIASPVVPGLLLHERIRRADDVAALVEQARRMPALLANLVAGGLTAPCVLSVYSALVDAVIRRMLELVFVRHPDLSPDAFTWLSLGSNGRREATLSSDVDCAVAFHEPLPQTEIDRYRAVFLEMTGSLAEAGLTGDGHGATAAHKLFARSSASWEEIAQQWLADPSRDNGAMMVSLLLDARPIHGGLAVPAVDRMVAELRAHSASMRMLLDESLAKRARLRPMVRVFPGRESFDIKRDALLPIVNLARWAALMVGSSALPTTERLRAAAGSSILPARQAATLIEVFEVLQAIRLRRQLKQVERGRPATDHLHLDRISAIDRSIIARAVREIAMVQQRMANLSRYEGPEDWARPDPRPEQAWQG